MTCSPKCPESVFTDSTGHTPSKLTDLPAESLVEVAVPEPTQVALDSVDEASMESFPCSDPPSYTMRHM